MNLRAAFLAAALGVLAGPSGLLRAENARTGLVSTAWSPAELQSLIDELASPDANSRAGALSQLATLGEDALDAIEKRSEALRRALDDAALAGALRDFRKRADKAAGGPAAALLSGARASLAKDTSSATRLAAEWVALVHALALQRSPEAAELVIGKLLGSAKDTATAEGGTLVDRLGPLAIPALIRARTSPRLWHRALCMSWLAAAGYDQPGRAVQQDDAHLLAAILEAYGDTLAFEAMPVVVAYLVDERAAVRHAAERASTRFGRNAIWQLRERYLNVTGRDAPAEWGHQRVLAELQREHFAERSARQARSLAAARALATSGEPSRALAELAPALGGDTSDELAAELARFLFTLGEASLVRRDPGTARLALARALRLDPSGVDAPRARARLLFLDAESLASAGVLDAGRYEAASALDPKFAPAQTVLDELSGRAEAREAWWRRIIAALAGISMAAGATFWLRAPRATPALLDPGEPADA